MIDIFLDTNVSVSGAMSLLFFNYHGFHGLVNLPFALHFSWYFELIKKLVVSAVISKQK